MAAATHSLCDTANALVQGNGSEEKLISAAKQVASSTAHLLVACRVKADADSSAMRRLQVGQLHAVVSLCQMNVYLEFHTTCYSIRVSCVVYICPGG